MAEQLQQKNAEDADFLRVLLRFSAARFRQRAIYAVFDSVRKQREQTLMVRLRPFSMMVVF